jgi:cytochrome c2
MKVVKWIGILLGVLVVMGFGVGIYIKVALPKASEPELITIIPTPDRLERGKYLAHHVAVCMDCHSTRDWSRYSGPMMPVAMGSGGQIFNQDMGFPGVFYSKNITPYALKTWNDGELFRAITEGVSKNGEALFPVMASHRFGIMDREDIYSIIAYVRTLTPIKREIPVSQPDFPVNILINTMPKKADFQKKPSETNTVEYGKYLVNVAGCVDCHSQTKRGAIIPGTEFGGGMEFRMSSGIVRTTNITPDMETGIGSWSSQAFLNRFKAYVDSAYVPPVVDKNGMNTPMPWMMYAGMSTNDLEAIHAYLMSLSPITNDVERFTPAQ